MGAKKVVPKVEFYLGDNLFGTHCMLQVKDFDYIYVVLQLLIGISIKQAHLLEGKNWLQIK